MSSLTKQQFSETSVPDLQNKHNVQWLRLVAAHINPTVNPKRKVSPLGDAASFSDKQTKRLPRDMPLPRKM